MTAAETRVRKAEERLKKAKEDRVRKTEKILEKQAKSKAKSKVRLALQGLAEPEAATGPSSSTGPNNEASAEFPAFIPTPAEHTAYRLHMENHMPPVATLTPAELMQMQNVMLYYQMMAAQNQVFPMAGDVAGAFLQAPVSHPDAEYYHVGEGANADPEEDEDEEAEPQEDGF